jgi:hypothetical protein
MGISEKNSEISKEEIESTEMMTNDILLQYLMYEDKRNADEMLH